MRFEHPELLWLLLIVPQALLAFLWWSWRKKQKLLGEFIEPRLLASLLEGLSPARRKLRFAFLVGAVVCLILTLARLQWGFDWEETKQRGLDIVVAIDTSKSMLADDIAPNRLARAKLAALDLMQQAKSDRLGLVAFAGVAFLQCPLTVDDAAFRQCVETLDTKTLPQGGTAIAEAIETARTAFKEQDNDKALVLFTDGEDHDPGALEAAQEAAKDGMRIFTIGIGTAEGELVRELDAKGRTEYVRDEDGNVVKSRLNEQLLSQIAQVTKGFYLPMRGADTIDKLYQAGLSKLTKTESEVKLVKRYHERYHWPLLLGILFLLAEMLFPERKQTARRTAAASAGAAAVTRAVAVGAVFLASGLFAGDSPAKALRDYRAGRHDLALREYLQLAEKKPDDLRLLFNAGAAAYRATNYAGAIQHFTAVLTAPDIKLQQAAYYNLGNTLFRRGETAEDLDAMQESWETAIKNYQNAVTLNPADADAKFNLAFVTKCVEQIVQLRELVRRAKAAADEATRRRNYHEALQILDQLVKSNPFAKPFQDYAKRLQDIDSIATPSQP